VLIEVRSLRSFSSGALPVQRTFSWPQAVVGMADPRAFQTQAGLLQRTADGQLLLFDLFNPLAAGIPCSVTGSDLLSN